MTKQQVKEFFLNLVGITPEQKTAIDARLAVIPDDAPAPAPVVNTTAPVNSADFAAAVQAAVESAMAPVKQALADAAAREKAASEAATAAALAQRNNDIKKLLDDAVTAGKIPADNKEKRGEWEKRFGDSFDTAKFALEQIPAPISGGTGNLNKDGKTGEKSGVGATPRTGMAARITNDKIAEYVSNIPVAPPAKS